MNSSSQRSPYKDALDPYAQPSLWKGIAAILTSVVPAVALLAASYYLETIYWLLGFVLAPVIGGFLVRTFVVFHDCSHGSLLPTRQANARVGRVLGLFVLAPFTSWRNEHAVHHATAGDLDRRGVGDVETLTVDEYFAKSVGERRAYRLFRNPAIMFGIGPIVAMIIGPRVAKASMPARKRNSVLLNDLFLALLIGSVVWLIGPIAFLIIWLPSAMIGGAFGIWLFYVQHQFEDAYWQRTDSWDYFDAALCGSSFLDLPEILRFFSFNIGYHHLHHLNPRIPGYNLPKAHASHPRFAEVPVLKVPDGIRAVKLKLWDEQSGRLVTFAQARAGHELAVLDAAAASNAAGAAAGLI